MNASARKTCLGGIGWMAIAGHAAASEELTWLEGHWCGSNHGDFNEEIWTSPRAGMLLGLHRDSRGDQLRGFEFLRIERDGDHWVYRAQPGGHGAVSFDASTLTEISVEFVNPQHDYPQRIRYRLIDADTLQATVDGGAEDAEPRRWTWTRDCSSPPVP